MNKETLMLMIDKCHDLDSKLDLLTTIEVLTTCDDILKSCREIRNDLCAQPSGLEELI